MAAAQGAPVRHRIIGTLRGAVGEAFGAVETAVHGAPVRQPIIGTLRGAVALAGGAIATPPGGGIGRGKVAPAKCIVTHDAAAGGAPAAP